MKRQSSLSEVNVVVSSLINFIQLSPVINRCPSGLLFFSLRHKHGGSPNPAGVWAESD